MMHPRLALKRVRVRGVNMIPGEGIDAQQCRHHSQLIVWKRRPTQCGLQDYIVIPIHSRQLYSVLLSAL
jgi:hypothetical protein